MDFQNFTIIRLFFAVILRFNFINYLFTINLKDSFVKVTKLYVLQTTLHFINVVLVKFIYFYLKKEDLKIVMVEVKLKLFFKTTIVVKHFDFQNCIIIKVFFVIILKLSFVNFI